MMPNRKRTGGFQIGDKVTVNSLVLNGVNAKYAGHTGIVEEIEDTGFSVWILVALDTGTYVTFQARELSRDEDTSK